MPDSSRARILSRKAPDRQPEAAGGLKDVDGGGRGAPRAGGGEPGDMPHAPPPGQKPVSSENNKDIRKRGGPAILALDSGVRRNDASTDTSAYSRAHATSGLEGQGLNSASPRSWL